MKRTPIGALEGGPGERWTFEDDPLPFGVTYCEWCEQDTASFGEHRCVTCYRFKGFAELRVDGP